MTRAGTLRKRVTVQRDMASDPADADSFGEVDADWQTLTTRWMGTYPAKGQERDRDGTQVASQAVVFTGRYDSRVTEKDRLSYGGELYDIISIENVGMRNKDMRITAIRRDGD